MSTERPGPVGTGETEVVLGGCGACYADDDLRLLAGDPELVPDELVRLFAEEAPSHWSPAAWQWLWRRLAHRVVALVAAREVDPGRALRGLAPGCADLPTWPDGERRAVRAALGDVLAVALAAWPASDVADLLCGLACVDGDLRPWPAHVDALTGPGVEGGVVRLACHWATGLNWGETSWCTWWSADDQVTPVREWTSAVRPGVERFAERHPECKTARDALIAYDHLERDEPGPWYYPGTGWSRWERMGQPGHYNWLEPV